jgi:hypothetical protein
MASPLETVDLIAKITPVIFGILAVIVSAFVYLRRGRLKVGQFTLDFDSQDIAEAEAARIRQQTAPELGEAPAEKQFALLREYHAQGLAQSKISFWFSLVFASIGFAVIIAAVLTIDPAAPVSIAGKTGLSMIAGTIIDAVAALFFVQSNKARQLMVDFFDRLRKDRKLEESLKVASQIKDPLLSSRLAVVMALNLADAMQSDELVSKLLAVPTVEGSSVTGADQI